MVIASSPSPASLLRATPALGAFGATPEHHRAAHHFGDMFPNIISFSNHAVITAKE